MNKKEYNEANEYDARATELINQAQQEPLSAEDATWLQDYIVALGNLADGATLNCDLALQRVARMRRIIGYRTGLQRMQQYHIRNQRSRRRRGVLFTPYTTSRRAIVSVAVLGDHPRDLTHAALADVMWCADSGDDLMISVLRALRAALRQYQNILEADPAAHVRPLVR